MSHQHGYNIASRNEFAARMLGQTNDVVVYIAPDGSACVEQDESLSAHRHRSHPTVSRAVQRPKRLGERLVEAGLISPVQRDVALYDQESTGMRLGEILVARGWIDEETVELFVVSPAG